MAQHEPRDRHNTRGHGHSTGPVGSDNPRKRWCGMNDRHIVVVDLETTGFDPLIHTCVEVSWWDLTANQRGYFIPPHHIGKTLATANVDALRITRYIDRIPQLLQDDGTGARLLADALHGHTLAGSNPAFDASFLKAPTFPWEQGDSPIWHHRMWDLSPYAAGVLKLDHLPGLAEVCELLDVANQPDHTADMDVTVTGKCICKLLRMTGQTKLLAPALSGAER